MLYTQQDCMHQHPVLLQTRVLLPFSASPLPSLCTQGSTFGIPGVLEHAHFLRDVKQAEAIRNKLIENLALAGVPGGAGEQWGQQRLNVHLLLLSCTCVC